MHKSSAITYEADTFPLQAAKEFETELTKDGEPSPEASNEKPTTVSEEEKQEDKVPSANGSS